MILADSGYLIALAKPRDTLHSRAVAWSRLIDEPLLVSGMWFVNGNVAKSLFFWVE